MSSVPLLWLGVVLALPVAIQYYVPAMYRTMYEWPRIDGSGDRYIHWLYSIPTVGVATAVFLFAPVEISFEFRVWYLLFPVVGAGMYFLDTYVKYLAVQKPIAKNTQAAFKMVPILFLQIPEEIVYRVGFLPLVDAAGWVVYLVVSSLAFGVLHLGFGKEEAVFKSVNGLVYGGLFLATGSIVPSMLAHTGYNVGSYYVIADFGGDGN